jgi:hypothetical protein
MASRSKSLILLKVLGGCAIALAVGVVWAAATYGFLPPRTSTISLLHAGDTFKQCSRDAPVPDGAYWIPTASQIRAIEPALPALGRRYPPGYQNEPAVDTVFIHQYIGFTRKGARLIYVNVTPIYEPGEEELAARSWLHRAEVLLPEQPVRPCDGGPNNWGVVYNPATKTFGELQFNF